MENESLLSVAHDTDGRLSPAEVIRRNVNNVVQPLLTGNVFILSLIIRINRFPRSLSNHDGICILEKWQERLKSSIRSLFS